MRILRRADPATWLTELTRPLLNGRARFLVLNRAAHAGTLWFTRFVCLQRAGTPLPRLRVDRPPTGYEPREFSRR